MQTGRKRAALMAAALALTATPALAQSDWTQVAHDSRVNVTFFYSPASVRHNGGLSTARWHDTNHPELVFTAEINCQARTIRSLSADVYNPDGSLKQTVDLAGQASPDPLGQPGTFGANLAQRIC